MTNPRDPNVVSHHGAHALSPTEGGRVSTLEAMTGRVLHANSQGGGLFVVDVAIGGGLVASYFDLSSVNVRTGQTLREGSIVGSVRPAGDPRNQVGLHVTLTHSEHYNDFRRMRQAGGIGFPRHFFVDPLGPGSPINCPGVPVR